MPQWVRSLTTQAAGRVLNVLTLAALGALALWGWHNDWRLSPTPAAAPGGGKQAAAESAVRVLADSPGSGPARIEFPSAAAVGRVGIQVARVRVQDLAHAVTAPGMVDYEPGRYARLTARASGSVLRVDKEIGDPVRKGELLALIDAAEVGRIKADLLRDRAQVQFQSANVKRYLAGSVQGVIPDQSLRQAETALREARIRLLGDQQALLNLGLPVRLEDLEGLPDDQVVRRLRLLGLPEAAVRAFDPETLTASLLPLTAPFDGQVVERNVATGEVVHVGQAKPLFVVGDVRRLHIDLDVNPQDMARVRLGQRVTFRPQDGGPEAAGRVSHISPEVNDKTRRVQVRAEVPNEDRRLRPNTFGTGRIVVAEHPRAAVVPGEAVRSDGHAHFVFVRVSATAFEARPVQPGLRQGDLVEVRGVREGEEVVTAGSHLLMSELQKDRIAGGDE